MQDQHSRAPVLLVMVGLPASGKTTRAIELEREWSALRLTPDEWLIPLFRAPDEVGRDILEGRFIWLARRALRCGTNVILDFGVWSRDERTALRAMALSVDARPKLVYLDIGEDEQRRRVVDRQSTQGSSTFFISEKKLRRYRSIFEPPAPDEFGSSALDAAPSGYESWDAWSAIRWPTSDVGLGTPVRASLEE